MYSITEHGYLGEDFYYRVIFEMFYLKFPSCLNSPLWWLLHTNMAYFEQMSHYNLNNFKWNSLYSSTLTWPSMELQSIQKVMIYTTKCHYIIETHTNLKLKSNSQRMSWLFSEEITILIEKTILLQLESQQWGFPNFINSLNPMNLSWICVE